MNNFLNNQTMGANNFHRSWLVTNSLPIEFNIKYSSDIFNPTNPDILEVGDSDRRMVVVDKVVWGLYGEKIANYFKACNIKTKYTIVECIEATKNAACTEIILADMEEFQIVRRAEPIIAIGGGILLDLVGYAASIYRRGVPYIRVPTTLLGLVDASVGVKTGINHFDRRNRLGSYYPPAAVYLDKKFVKTQDSREISNGIGEILKLAIIKDLDLFILLEDNASILIDEKFQYGAVPVRIINRAISGMVEELVPNLWEKRLDRCVDFGHSFAPMVEMTYVEELLHGEAVVLDCLFSSCISYHRDILTKEELERIFATTKKLGLLTSHHGFEDPELLWKGLTDTVKHRNGDQNLPLPDSIGNYVFCNDFTKEELQPNIDLMKSLA